MKRIWAATLLATVLAACGGGVAETAEPAASVPAAATPEPKPYFWWRQRHEECRDQVRALQPELVFLGDSLTQHWETEGASVWDEFYGARRAGNLGVRGDRTQQLLWRLEDGAVEGIAPRVLVLMVGTNNVPHDTPADLAAGIEAIVRQLLDLLPDSRILLLGVFPRYEFPDDPGRLVIGQTNARLASLHDGERVHFQDLAPFFLQADGVLPASLMPDFLHPSAAGYRIWAEAIEPLLAQLLAD